MAEITFLDTIKNIKNEVRERLTFDGRKMVFDDWKKISSESMIESSEPEAFTKEFVIEMVFNFLELEKLPEKQFETPTGKDRSVDYQIKNQKSDIFLVEAKPINADLYDKSKEGAVNQIKGLFKLAEVKDNYKFGIATDGFKWVFIDNAGEVANELDLEKDYEQIKEFLAGKEKVVSSKTEEDISKKFYDWYNALLHGGRYKDHKDKTGNISERDCFVNNIFNVENTEDKEQIAQILMDRLIFIKFLHSKGIIKEDVLKKLAGCPDDILVPKLRQLFFSILDSPPDERFDIKDFKDIPYLNGSLFTITDVERENDYRVKADILRKAIEFLDSFRFVGRESLEGSATLDPEILGYIFERAMTATDRKGTGAYYTPKAITRYISENTIYPFIIDRANEFLMKEKGYKETELIKDIDRLFILPAPTLEEIWNNIIHEIRVLDNACGSGAFLLAAGNLLFDLNKRIDEKLGFKNTDIALKRLILSNNLHGVDINPKGIEITKLRLWLWLADSYDPEHIQPLPNIEYNLRAGNSLIGYHDISRFEKMGGTLLDYSGGGSLYHQLQERARLIKNYKNKSGSEAKELKRNIETINSVIKKLLDTTLYNELKENKVKIERDEFDRLSPFHWAFEFYFIFDPEKPKDERGFDVVIGNPPYLRIQILNKTDKKQVDYFNKYYKSAVGNYDIYGLFVERSLSLTHGGFVGFIMPNKFFLANYGECLRRIISDKNALNAIVNFKDNQIFQGASTYTCLAFFRENSSSCKYSEITKIKNLFQDLNTISDESEYDNGNITVGGINSTLGPSPWVFNIGKSGKIIEKLTKIKKTLEDYSERIFQGVATSADAVYLVKIVNEENDVFEIFSTETQSKHKIEKDVVRPLVKGKDIKGYFVEYKNRAIIFPYHKVNGVFKIIKPDILSTKYPKCFAYFKQNEEKIKSREDSKFRNTDTWYEYTYPRSINLYEISKILTPNSAFSASFYLDDKEYYYMTCGVAGGYGIKLKEDCSLNEKYLLALLNSKLLDFYNKKIGTCLRGGFYSYEGRVIKRYPIVELDRNKQKPFIDLADKMLSLNERLKEIKGDLGEKARIEKDIKDTDKKIDEVVYGLYGLSDEEIKVVEGSG